MRFLKYLFIYNFFKTRNHRNAFTKQMELDKTAEDFRRVHHERQEVIRQWENAIQQMQKRDQQIDHCALVKLLCLICITMSAYFSICEIERNFATYS